jgi:hypothetical protein
MGGPAKGFKKAIGMAERQGVIKKKSDEQPKVQAQMDAPKDENVEAQQSLDRKRKARRSTILTSSVGANEDVMLGYKTLLG